MMVCNICFGAPEYSGFPKIKRSKGNGTEQYLFGSDAFDLCKECYAHMREGHWEGLAKRAREALMLRLGVDPKAGGEVPEHVIIPE